METLVRTEEQEELSSPHRTEYPLESVEIRPHRMYLALKRGMDILLAVFVGLLLLLPMLIIALIIKIDSPGPALFKQDRMGKGGKVFTIYKFRSMRMDAPSEMASREFVDSRAYITRFGAFIRRTSLDELPQLINVLNGTMSFVGYRPVCLTEVELNALRKEYGVFAIRPGLTGLAQVSGRDNVSARDKAQIDAEYLSKCGIKMDLRCLLKTITVVFSGEGVM